MKIKLLLPLMISTVLISACGQNENNKPRPNIPPIGENGDEYVDKLPVDTRDGNILHCFNWTYKQIEENLTTIANAGFKSVQVSPVQQPKSGGAFWWAYYQPVSLSVAESTPLGTKAELKSLCEKADDLGVSVIADIVFNHLANASEDAKEDDGTPTVSGEVQTYEPEIYAHRNDKDNPTFHHTMNPNGSGVVTQYYPYGALPDLNTSNKLVQERAYGLLKECIDLGIDGFRFDAAKHIETPTDPQYASDFWPNTLGKARTYYEEKTNKKLFAYGEILNDVEGGRKISDYTNLMDVTDSGYISNELMHFVKGDAEGLSKASYAKNTKPENLITWIESHDSYKNKGHQPLRRVGHMWTILSSRVGSRGLFFARPDDDKNVGKIADYMFESETVAVANRFHNRFIGAKEEQTFDKSFYINQRFDSKQSGAVVVALAKEFNLTTKKFKKLYDGTYYDQITGNKVKVKNGKATLAIDPDVGIAVLTTTKNLPRPEITFSDRGNPFVGEKTIKITAKNVQNITCKINGIEKGAYNKSFDIKIGDIVDDNNMINLEITATNGSYEIVRKATYRKVELIPGGFNVVNFNMNYFNDYEVYLWSWNPGKYSKNYTIKDDVILVDTKNLEGFLFVLFKKGTKPTANNKWEEDHPENIVRQSSDIKGSILTQGFWDASGF